MPRSFVTADRILTVDGWKQDHGLMIESGCITDVASTSQAAAADHHFADGIIVPGFIDVQVNGGGGVLFNDDISATAIRKIGATHARFGTTGFLPTLISDAPSTYQAALSATSDAIASQIPGVLGVHLEGPFLNAEKKGIHDAGYFRPLDDGAFAQLIGWKDGALVITVAPEVIGTEMIGKLNREGVIVCAGHTAATYEDTRAALAQGLRGFTHLFNAMPPMLSRAPGPVAAALESDAWCGIIADGHHVAPSMLGLALRAKTDGRFLLVSDAMAAAGSDDTSFDLRGTKINVQDGRCVDEHGTLAGSSITMIDAVRYCIQKLQVSFETALSMASRQPAEFLGLGDELGTLAPGFRANFAVLSPQLDIMASFIDGEEVYRKH